MDDHPEESLYYLVGTRTATYREYCSFEVSATDLESAKEIVKEDPGFHLVDVYDVEPISVEDLETIDAE